MKLRVWGSPTFMLFIEVTIAPYVPVVAPSEATTFPNLQGKLSPLSSRGELFKLALSKGTGVFRII